jgi:parallel beta-helix repeat protein
VRTNVMAGNVLHGLHITGKARDLWVDPNIIGLNTYGTQATYTGNDGQEISWGNGGDGIRVEGHAQDILIAGQRRSVIPQNTVSNNGGHGIRIDGQARLVTIDNTLVGLSSTGRSSFGNVQGGIQVGTGTRQIAIGQRLNQRNGNRIDANGGPGIELIQPLGASLFNNRLSSNAGSGVVFVGGSGNTLIGNNARDNQGYGFAISSASASRIARNSGEGNTEGLYG